jgi:hypothetical protein
VGGTYKLITLAGTSSKSFADAVRRAIKDASKTVRGITWFDVDQLRGRVEDGGVAEYQVIIRAGFKVEASEEAEMKEKKAKAKRKRG